MLKKNLWKACMLLVTIVLLSFTVKSDPGIKSTLKHGNFYKGHSSNAFLKDTAFFRSHSFDSLGFCTCLDGYYDADDLSSAAPKITLSTDMQLFVADYIRQNGYLLDKINARGVYNLSIIEKVFEKRGLPVELKYLAVIESKLKNSAVSKVGAAGLWQLMPTTAKWMGLKVAGNVDERKNAYKSSIAAAKYIEYLYNIYEDWLLVVAAYNSGPGLINKAIKQTGSTSFWKIQNKLPLETRMHVKRFISTHYYFEGHGSLATMTKKETERHLSAVKDYLALLASKSNEDMANNEQPREKHPEHSGHAKIIAVIHNDETLELITKK